MTCQIAYDISWLGEIPKEASSIVAAAYALCTLVPLLGLRCCVRCSKFRMESRSRCEIPVLISGVFVSFVPFIELRSHVFSRHSEYMRVEGVSKGDNNPPFLFEVTSITNFPKLQKSDKCRIPIGIGKKGEFGVKERETGVLEQRKCRTNDYPPNTAKG